MSDCEGSVPPLADEHEGAVWPDAFAHVFAQYLSCDPDDVLAAFGPEFRLHWRWAGRQAHENIIERREALRREVKSAATSKALQELDLIADLLTGVSNRSRGRNAQAHMLALAVGRTFQRLDERVTFGTHPYETDDRHAAMPSTKFGRAVYHAFKLTGLTANWEAPAKKAFKIMSSSYH